MSRVYFVRHGLMRRVGRFQAESDDFARGQSVVVRSWRGTELGEVLAAESQTTSASPELPATARLLRLARAEDLARAREVEGDRAGRLAAFERMMAGKDWPAELIDAEILLDGRTVVHYLGLHRLGDALTHTLSDGSGLDVLLEPAGPHEADEVEDSHGCGGGCSTSGGGCSSGGGGCSGCGVKELVASRKVAAGR